MLPKKMFRIRITESMKNHPTLKAQGTSTVLTRALKAVVSGERTLPAAQNDKHIATSTTIDPALELAFREIVKDTDLSLDQAVRLALSMELDSKCSSSQ